MTFSESDLNDWDGWLEGHAKIPTGTVAVSRVKDLIDEIRRLRKEKDGMEQLWKSNLLHLDSLYKLAGRPCDKERLQRLIELGKALEAMPVECSLHHASGFNEEDEPFDYWTVNESSDYYNGTWPTPLEALQAASSEENE